MSSRRPDKTAMPARRRVRRALVPAAALMAASMLAGGVAARAETTSGLSLPNPTPPSRADLKAADAAYSGGGVSATPDPSASRRRRGGSLFPKNRLVALYGSTYPGFGELGRRRPNAAVRKIRKQARAYARKGDEPVIRAFDLVATVATKCERRRDKCRYRISSEAVDKYLAKVRGMDGILILDIQPGRSTFMTEVKHWAPYLRQPDVGVALDPEWNVGRHGEVGEEVGSVNAKKLNEISRKLQNIVDERRLPDKPMIVHQFRQRSIRHRDHVKLRDDVDVTLNFDGIGARAPKRSAYDRLQQPPLFNGFSLFYKLDTDLMRPGQVLRLKPPPNYVMYQ